MPPRKSTTPPVAPKPPLALTTSRIDAAQRLTGQINKGKALRDASITSRGKLEELESAKRKWKDFSSHLLEVLFTNDEPKTQFDEQLRYWMFSVDSLQEEIQDFRKIMGAYVECLESIVERLDLFPEPSATLHTGQGNKERDHSNRKVFVVHGRDEAAKLAVARFLEAMGFEPIILHEQANRGDTIIEKFERNADVGFAVVLLTPDDIGGPKDAKEFQPRARQNVIAELGYFVGTLGRGRVLPLLKGALEIPTDFSGVVYTEMDDRGRWKTELANELDAAGFEVDFRKAARA